MSVLKWIHLSDIHMTSSAKSLEKYNRGVVLQELWKDIDSRVSNISNELKDLDFAFITGDLAFSGGDSGSEDEYEEVYNNLILPLSQHTGIAINNIFLVPGNHDISRSAITQEVIEIEERLSDPDSITRLLIDSLSRENKDKIFSRLINYNNFVKTYLKHIPLANNLCTYSKVMKIHDNKISLRIVGLNSAWLSRGESDDKGKLLLGEPIIRNIFEDISDDMLTITLIHHPLKNPTEWYKEIEKNTINQILRQTDFLLCGHVHELDVTSQLRTQGGLIELTGGSIYKDRKWTSNSYNYVVFNTNNGRGKTFLRRYHDQTPRGPVFMKDLLSTGEKLDGVMPIILNKDFRVKNGEDTLISSFNHFIELQTRDLNNRPLLSEIYPDRDSMKTLFPDVYVDPYVIPRRNPTDSPIPLSRWFTDYFKENMKVLILGAAGTGKTTSLIKINHKYSEEFLTGNSLTVPFFYEARNYQWNKPLKVENIVKDIKNRYGLHKNACEMILSRKIPAMTIVDAMDEAFPRVYQELGTFSSDKLYLDFSHIASSRIDFFERNLKDVNFCSQYNEILVLEPWQLNREVTLFLENYFSKKHGASYNREELNNVKKNLEDLSGNQDLPLTALSVTAFLFLWEYDQDFIEANPITSFASLVERFSILWAKREVERHSNTFVSTEELLEAYEVVAWQIYLNREKGAAPLMEIARIIAERTKKKVGDVMRDRGLLSMLRTKIDRYLGNTQKVISFTHQAIYEYFLARRLTKALSFSTKNQEILNHLLGHSVNRLARQLLLSLPDDDKKKLVITLRDKYYSLLPPGKTLLKEVFRKLIEKSGLKVKEVNDQEIIKRHNICYFWSRLEAGIGGDYVKELFLRLNSGEFSEHEMVKSTVGSSMLLMNDERLERMYLTSISDNSANDVCNRVYHLVYYGDANYSEPGTFLKNNLEDWPKTREAILYRLNSDEPRAQALRALDLVTFRRLCETRGVPELDSKQKEIIRKCIDNLRLQSGKQKIIREEHKKLTEHLGI